jgi:starch phosphorylase
MKVLVNGGINLSELDGWWVEAYTPEVGWALGDGKEHGTDPAWDCAEAETLYRLLEREVIPQFYDRSAEGIPIAWVKRMRASMAQLTPRFSASRAVCEYAEKHYIPAVAAYDARAANKGALGKQVSDWQQSLREHWRQLRFGEMKIEVKGDVNSFEVEVFPGELDLHSIHVELYADGIKGAVSVSQEMKRLSPLAGTSGAQRYGLDVPKTRPAADYTARAIPRCPGAAVPLEAPQILWQR